MHTFGCKVNTYDTGLIQKNLKQNNILARSADDVKNKSQIHVLNTCAVTAEATQQAVRLIRKIKSTEPLATIVVTGCAAQVDTDIFRNLPGADLVVANSHKGLLPQIIDQYFKGKINDKVFKSNIFKKEELEADGGIEANHTRSFLKIQDGCNSFCTFCIIPYARGKSRSIPIAQLVHKINELANQNVQEVVLTGVHIGDYEDIKSGKIKIFDDLIETILNNTKIQRLRLSSLEPIEVSDRLLEIFKDPRLCPHFHMSIQSADTEVLIGMKRKYTSYDVQNSLKRIYQAIPHVFVGMDVIAGFPTETEQQFENTYQVLVDSPWTRLHVFPYSERAGTRAAALPQISFHVRKERAAQLRQLSLHRFQSEALKQIGSLKKVLVLNSDTKKYSGLADDYWSVKINAVTENELKAVRNSVQSVKIDNVSVQNSEVVLQGQWVQRA